MIEHHYGVEDYVAFMTEFDEETLVAGLDDDVRREIPRRAASTRWPRSRRTS